MATKRIPRAALLEWWSHHGAGLCAEAQSDGVPCIALGRDCETCEHALAAWLAAHPEDAHGNGDGAGDRYDTLLTVPESRS